MDRRTLLQALPAAALTAPALAAGGREASELPALIKAHRQALDAFNAVCAETEEVDLAIAALPPIEIPLAVLPDEGARSGCADLAVHGQSGVEAKIRGTHAMLRATHCTPFVQALAPDHWRGVFEALEASEVSCLRALQAGVEAEEQRRDACGYNAVWNRWSDLHDAEDAALCAILRHVPRSRADAMMKAEWLRAHLRSVMGHLMVGQFDALIASIAGVELPSYAEGL